MDKLFHSLRYLHPRSFKELSGQIAVLIEQKLWAKVLTGMFAGVAVGILLSSTGPFADQVTSYQDWVDGLFSWLVLPAQLFLKIIKMVIIPLIFSSIIMGLASTTDAQQMKDLGLRFVIYVVVSSSLAAALGIFLTTVFAPGAGMSLAGAAGASADESGGGLALSPDVFLNILPINPISSFVEGQMLDVVILSIIAGVALVSIKQEQANTVIDILDIIQQICMKVISWAMRLAPIAVFGMIAQVTSSTGVQTLQNMAVYVLVCFLGFALFIGLFALLVFLRTKMSPLVFLQKSLNAILLAFSTSSSAATMPTSIRVAEDELGVSPTVAGFIIPLGSTINMAGSTIWHTSAVIFLSQAYDVQLSISQILIVVATSIASAIGSPGVPGVGVGILSTILSQIGIPLEGISLIMGVDRIVDMGCTTVNVTSDIAASKFLDSPAA